MDPDILTESVNEAQRYIGMVEKLLAAQEQRGDTVLFGSKESGAVRRASLDLTRVLAELRNRKMVESP